jgi:glycosyltransferase involved in cell wall biosynthesis
LYAQELLSFNRGFLCEFRSSASIAQRVNMLLDDPDLRRATERRAYRFGRQMTWPHVAGEYANVFLELAPTEALTLVSSA